MVSFQAVWPYSGGVSLKTTPLPGIVVTAAARRRSVKRARPVGDEPHKWEAAVAERCGGHEQSSLSLAFISKTFPLVSRDKC